MNIQHSSRTDTWYTPTEYVAAVHAVLGKPALDPASDDRANLTIQADRYISVHEDGLATDWGAPGSVYLNPPGGKVGNKSLAGLFWSRLMANFELGFVGHAIFMAFSAEQLQSTQKPGQRSLLDFPFCVPRQRIRFVSPGVEKHSPSHSNVIVYVPGYLDRTERFVEVFSQFGKCRT